VRLLAFSDLHRDLRQAGAVVERSHEVDVVVGVGDFASMHSGLEETIGALCVIDKPTVLVPGNNETDEALRDACAVFPGWPAATVLHGDGTEIGGVAFFGLGAGVPLTPWEWSFDLSEEEAEAKLAACPAGAVLVVHSPPFGHVDGKAGRHLGSAAVLRAIEATGPRLALCGHIHECWGRESRIGATRVLNVGPSGALIDL
jgi:Icc-related predicted phosphoesterase